MARPSPNPRWLIVVQREQPDLYRDLCRNFAPDARVQVILDRRQTERRREAGRVESDRRRQRRRRTLTTREVDLWQMAGVQLFYRDDDMRVYEVSGGNGPVEDPQALGRRRKVLVIDDDPGVREVVGEFLGLLGLEAEGAATGMEGLARLEAGVYDLVVTDLTMPGMTGWEVVAAVRRRVPTLAVIMISGSASDLDVEQARRQGVTLLRKPVGLEELRQAVAPALGGSQGAPGRTS